MDAEAMFNATEKIFDVAVYSTVALPTNEPGLSGQGHEAIQLVTLSLFMTIFVFGVSGNILTIYVIGRLYTDSRRRRASGGGRRSFSGSGGTGSQSVSNVYILNLAAADLLFLLTLPLFCYVTWYRRWGFGVFTCKLALAVRETNKYASVLILVALSVDRCLATFHRVSIGWRRISVAVVVCLGIWIVCLAGPGGLQIKYGMVNEKRNCQFKLPWEESQARTIWVCAQFILNVVVPFAIIVVVNVILLRRLRSFADKSSKRSVTSRQSLPVGTSVSGQNAEHNNGRTALAEEQTRTGSRSVWTRLIGKKRSDKSSSSSSSSGPLAFSVSSSTSSAMRRERASRNMVRLVLAIIFIFVVCQLPYHVVEYVSLQMFIWYSPNSTNSTMTKVPPKPDESVTTAFKYANSVAQVLVFVSSSLNPILYGVFNKNYRKIYRDVLCGCFFHRLRQSPEADNSTFACTDFDGGSGNTSRNNSAGGRNCTKSPAATLSNRTAATDHNHGAKTVTMAVISSSSTGAVTTTTLSGSTAPCAAAATSAEVTRRPSATAACRV